MAPMRLMLMTYNKLSVVDIVTNQLVVRLSQINLTIKQLNVLLKRACRSTHSSYIFMITELKDSNSRICKTATDFLRFHVLLLTHGNSFGIIRE